MSLFRHRLLMAKALEMANPYLPWDTPKVIKDAMVLYYDIAKQKATNESMVENPTLKDLSGNGNDATCYNFEWSEMSGIGGYSINFNNWVVNKSVQVEKNSTYFKLIDGTNNINKALLCFNASGGVPSFSVRITNLIGSLHYQIFDGDVKIEVPIDGDGIFTAEKIEPTNHPIGFFGDVENGLTIELIPLYPNALVSDGVNDYCLVQDRYATDFSTNYFQYITGGSRGTGTVESNKITITSVKATSVLIEERAAVTNPIKIRVTGLPEGVSLLYSKQVIPQYTITKDGEYELPILEHTPNIGFSISSTLSECNIVIEQLPLNKKSLVLNKEDGYTVIAKRKWLNYTVTSLACKNSNSIGNTDGEFQFEFIDGTGPNRKTRSYGVSANLDNFADEYVVYQTSTSYNGTTINSGNVVPTDKLGLFVFSTSGPHFANIALYSLLLFNRDLTDEEIQWVKNNLMQ